MWFNAVFVDSAPFSDDNTYLQHTAANAWLEFCLKWCSLLGFNVSLTSQETQFSFPEALKGGETVVLRNY